MDVPFGKGAYARSAAGDPEITLVNWRAETSPLNADSSYDLIQRPGLEPFATVGAAGHIRGVEPDGGILDAQSYFVCGDGTWATVASDGTVSVLTTSIPGTDKVIMAGSSGRMILARGSPPWSSDGTSGGTALILMPERDSDLPDSEYANVGSVAYLAGYFVLATVRGRMYFMAQGDAAPGALDYFTAEQRADPINVVIAYGDELWAMGPTSIEIYTPSGNADLPFTLQTGRTIDRGCISRNCVAVVDDSVMWVGGDLMVYRSSNGGAQRISDHGIEERLRQVADIGATPAITAWSYTLDGHAVFALTIQLLGTFTYDAATQAWAEYRSPFVILPAGAIQWNVWVGAQNGSQVIAGDSTTNKLFRLDQTLSTDDGHVFHREATALCPIIGPPQAAESFTVATNPGATLSLSWSDDQGQTYSDGVDLATISPGGNMEVTRLGLMTQPYRLWRVTCDDDVTVRLSYARVNEGFAR